MHSQRVNPVTPPVRILSSDELAVVRFTEDLPDDRQMLEHVEDFICENATREWVLCDLANVSGQGIAILGMLLRMHRHLTTLGHRLMYCGISADQGALVEALRQRNVAAVHRPVDQYTLQMFRRQMSALTA